MGFRTLIFLFLLLANQKLYLKDGTFHLVREYKVESDRVRYYSVERSDWEEIPLELVDLKRTARETGERAEHEKQEAAALDAEDKAERAARDEIERVPVDAGAYFVAGNELKTLKQAEAKVVTNKRRSILKVLSPVPLISGKATVELDGEKAGFLVDADRPEFYFRPANPERFGIIRLTPLKGVRQAAKLTIVPVSNETAEEMLIVEVFRRQVADNLYKIWPVKPLEPGEYAVVEYTEGKANLQLWDFAWRGSSTPER